MELESQLKSSNSENRNLEKQKCALEKKLKGTQNKIKTPNKPDPQIGSLKKQLSEIQNSIQKQQPATATATTTATSVIASPADVVVLPKAAFDDYRDARSRHEEHNMQLVSSMTNNQHHLSYLANVNDAIVKCNGNLDAITAIKEMYTRPWGPSGPN